MGLPDRQLESLNSLVATISKGNAFYQAKLSACGGANGFESLEAYSDRMPFTTKAELANDQVENGPYGTNLSYPLEAYTRIHQTSGTTGRPMAWLDTQDGWNWVTDNWKDCWEACGARAGDCSLFPFSFGPFLGFWAAFEAGLKMGIRCIPCGGQSSLERLKMIDRYEPNWMCCTPTYALHLIGVAKKENVDLSNCSIRNIIVGGESGGSVPEVRERIESGLGARVFDHHGMTETGPVTYSDKNDPDLLRILHESYYTEVLDPVTQSPVALGEVGELVLTTLGRAGSPLLRYRTGDLVKPVAVENEDPRAFALKGGIIGRADDMVVVRGVNLYPSAVDAVVRSFEGIGEYQVSIDGAGSMVQVSITIENTSSFDDGELKISVEKRMREVFGLRIPISVLSEGSLPQFEMKARRWKITK